MAELHMFPQNGSAHPEAKIARLEAHVFHLLQKQKELEAEMSELKKDREAMIRTFGFRAILVLAAIVGALVSSGSEHATLIPKLLGAIG